MKPLDRYYENEVDHPNEVEELPSPVEQILADKIVPAEPVAVSKQQKPKPKPAAMKMEGLHRNNPKTFKEVSKECHFYRIHTPIVGDIKGAFLKIQRECKFQIQFNSIQFNLFVFISQYINK